MIAQEDARGVIWKLHKRIVTLPNLFQELQKQNINPYWEYSKHPILNREISMGTKVCLKNFNLPENTPINTTMIYDVNTTTIEFYVILAYDSD